MIYTHVLKVGGGGVLSPVDTLPELPMREPSSAYYPGTSVSSYSSLADDRAPRVTKLVCRDISQRYHAMRLHGAMTPAQ